MDNELIIDSLTPEDFALLREVLREKKVSLGDVQKYIHLSDLLAKIDSIVLSIYD
jgi:hypothetical protein